MSSSFSHPASAATAEEEAYRHIQQKLRLGRYKAGERLIPEEIAAEIGMSRMPVREAFRRLASDAWWCCGPTVAVSSPA